MNWVIASEMLGGLLLALAILPRLFLWILRRSAFSHETLRRADEAIKRWDAVLAHDYREITGAVKGAFSANQPRFIGGAIGFIAWPLVVAFNSLVLAQIMELFVPTSGDTFFLPGIGDCQPMAVILALIVALSEAMLAIAAWHHGNWRIRLLAATGCVAAIGFEMYGGWLRGQIMSGLTVQEGLLAGHSASVSALIGFVAPTAEMVASVMSYEGVLVSLGLTFLRLPRAALLWCLLRVSRLVLGTSLERTWINLHPQVVETDAKSKAILSSAEVLLKDAKRLATAASEVEARAQQQSESSSEAVESANGSIASEAPDEVVQGYRERLQELHQEEALVEPKGPHRWMSRRQLREYRRQRRWQMRKIRALVIETEQKAYEDATHQLEAMQSAQASGGKADNHPSWQQLRAQADSLRGQATDYACEGNRLTSQVQEILTNLNLVTGSRALSDFDQHSQEENQRLATLTQNRCQGENGATTMLAQCELLVAEAAERLDGAKHLMNGRGLGPGLLLAGATIGRNGFVRCRGDIDTERSRFSLDTDYLMEQIVERERDARRLQFQRTPWGKVWGWVAGWKDDDEPVNVQ